MFGRRVPLGPVGYPLPSHESGYPLVYLDKKDRTLCATCCNDPACELGPAVLYDVYQEGEPLECEACGSEIASAYGPTEEA